MFNWFQRLFGLTFKTTSAERGERLAADWLRQERNFTIVARNWRNPRDRRDEIDLVCQDGEALLFVEVKTRVVGALVPGYYAVDERKKTVLRRAAGAYLAGLRDKPRPARFDVVEVTLSSGVKTEGGAPITDSTVGRSEILHFENVALFPINFRA